MSQTVLITGASRGIGAAAARRFAAGGYQVAVNYLQSQGAAEALCRELDNGSFPIQADVADPDQVRAMVDTVLQRFGHLDALVCNAGICLPGCCSRMSPTPSGHGCCRWTPAAYSTRPEPCSPT